MKIEGTHEIQASRDRVFELLTTPEVLQRCIPGCERLEKTGEDAYAATIRAGVGTIKGVFTGSVRLENISPPESFRMIVEGKGGPGFVKGTGELKLEAQGSNTLVNYNGDLQVGGTIAGVGQRMIQATGKMMAAQFFTALAAEASTESGAPPPQHGFFRTTLRWFSGWLKNIFARG